MKTQIKIAAAVLILGIIGILSLLQMDFPLDSLPEEAREEVLKLFTLQQLKWLNLINPAILLIITVTMGMFTAYPAGLRVPLLGKLLNATPEEESSSYSEILKHQLSAGLLGGLIAGLLIVGTAAVFQPYLPKEFLDAGKNEATPVLVRFLYGGITEEVLLRFGLMSFIALIGIKIAKKPASSVYWIAIILSSVIFGFGHFPYMYSLISEPTLPLKVYVLLGNSLGGMVFGWLYWKRGLESAMVGHAMTHATMLTVEMLIPAGS